MGINWSKEDESRILALLDLSDRQFRLSRIGKLIRDNFRLRGWLRNKARGKPGFKTTTGDSQV